MVILYFGNPIAQIPHQNFPLLYCFDNKINDYKMNSSQDNYTEESLFPNYSAYQSNEAFQSWK